MKRAKPLKRKATKPKRRTTGCKVRSCTRRGPFISLPEGKRCTFHVRQEADRLWSLAIRGRDKRCMARGLWGIECRGTLQAMHGMSRRYNATRWDLFNGLAGCAAHHEKMTHSHGHHEEFWDTYAPGVTYFQLRTRALNFNPMDPGAAVVALRDSLSDGGKS
jgi:hypothetical protein